jgi:hypothetical protein
MAENRMQGQALPTWLFTLIVCVVGVVVGLGLVVWFISMST